MRVALDMTVASRSETGVGVYARELGAALQAEGLDVLRWRHRLGPSVRGVPRLLDGIRLATWLHRLVPRLVRENGVTVLHSPSALGSIDAPCARVMTVHDVVALARDRQYGPLDRLYHRRWGVRAARQAHAVIVPSVASALEVAEIYGVRRERIHVVPLAVGPCFAPPEPGAVAPVLRRHGVTPPYVLFVGHAVPRKNLALLVRAFSEVTSARRAPGAQLVIAGPPGLSTPGVRRLVESSALVDGVRFLGLVSRDDLRVLYGAAACLAYPSLREGFGLPILEAMACGTPVLTSNLSSMAEVAGDAAHLIDPHSVESIAEGIARLLGDFGYSRELVARGFARAKQFDWRTTATLTRGVYEAAQVLAGAESTLASSPVPSR